MTEQAARRCMKRRHVMLGITIPIGLALAGLPGRQALAATRERFILLHHCHTGEVLKTVYFADGHYQPDALRAATHHLRDWHDNTQLPIDPTVLDLLWSLRAKLQTTTPIQVFCGYRSPETNAMLRRTHHGAARNSLHMRGMAVDLYVEGRPLSMVHAAAVGLRGGGVGYYPRSGFVHVDTGDIRYW